MLKVFLVEDEVVMRNGIKHNIPWESEGFQFVGEASDGELAYPLIKKEKPDILITDIRMPFMDGLELSRIVKKEMPQIKIIILSGYNEFDYARTAINIGVTDYLLKPISSARLLEAVKSVASIIEKEQEQAKMLERYRQEMEENVHLEKHRLWSALASNQLTTAELLERGQKLGMDFTASCYQVFLFKIMEGWDSTICSGQSIELSEKINAACAKWEHVLTFDRSPEGWAFLVKGQSEEELENSLLQCEGKLQNMMAQYPKLQYFGGIGNPVKRLGDIRSSYLEAAKAFASRFFSGANRLLRYGELCALRERQEDRIDISKMKSRKSEQELVEKFLKSGTVEEVGNFFDEYFHDLGSENYQSLLFRQYVVMDLYFACTDFLRGMNMDIERLPEKFRDINELINRISMQDTPAETMTELFTEVMMLRDGHSQKKYSALLEEAREFIRQNYQREDMSLNTVAAQVNISPSYFSAIFSGEMGQTFVEYLTFVRLDRAKELLMCSSMRTAEIGYEVGYKDSHYFSYIFKKVVGCSPKEYRNRGRD